MNHNQLRVKYERMKVIAIKKRDKAYTLARSEYWQGQIDLLNELITENYW